MFVRNVSIVVIVEVLLRLWDIVRLRSARTVMVEASIAMSVNFLFTVDVVDVSDWFRLNVRR